MIHNFKEELKEKMRNVTDLFSGSCGAIGGIEPTTTLP